MHELERRKAAIEATRARFEGRPHAYGKVDCIKIAAGHARHMGHHRALGLQKAGTWSSALGAMRALKKMGFDRVFDAVDAAGFEPIAPAMILPGDLIGSAGTDGLDAIGIWLGNMAILGFHEDAMEQGVKVIRLKTLSGMKAWRL